MSAPFAYPVVHLELHTDRLAGAGALYAELFGWRPRPSQLGDGSYLAVELGGGLSGGIVSCPTERPLWLPYVEVPEINSSTERARALGATVLLEPRPGPLGWRSVVGTSLGGEVALWQPRMYEEQRSCS